MGIRVVDWSTRELSSFYGRHRSHLVIYAASFLESKIEADEVVQDAFLYLLTAMPELDSEVGLLRFIKWKIRLLCFDVSRAKKTAPKIQEISDGDLISPEPEHSLVRAEEAAIVSIALSKLPPRQREAIVASVLMDMSNSEVAGKMGLSENAFRQLLLRARKSFKAALIGEAELANRSAGEVLSLAVSRASASSRKYLPTISASLVLLVTAAFGLYQAGAEPTVISSPQVPTLEADVDQIVKGQDSLSVSPEDPSIESFEDAGFRISELDLRGDFSQGLAAVPEAIVAEGVSFAGSESITDDNQLTDFREPSRNSIVDALGAESLLSLDNRLLEVSAVEVVRDIWVMTTSNGWTSHIGISRDGDKLVQFSFFEIEVDGKLWTAVPMTTHEVVSGDDENKVLTFAATDFIMGDLSGSNGLVSDDLNDFAIMTIVLTLPLSQQAEALSGKMEVVVRPVSEK